MSGKSEEQPPSYESITLEDNASSPRNQYLSLVGSTDGRDSDLYEGYYTLPNSAVSERNSSMYASIYDKEIYTIEGRKCDNQKDPALPMNTWVTLRIFIGINCS